MGSEGKPTRRDVDVGEFVRNAVLFNLKNHDDPDGVVNADTLFEDVERLLAVLHEREADYLLVGGVAILWYVEGRNTEDVDLVFAVSDLAKLPELEVEDEDADFVRGRFGGPRVDLLLTRNPLFD